MALEIERRFLFEWDSWREHICWQQQFARDSPWCRRAAGIYRSGRLQVMTGQAWLTLRPQRRGSPCHESKYRFHFWRWRSAARVSRRIALSKTALWP